MTRKEIITTDRAPAAIGTYSQAVKVGRTVYISGQIPLDPDSMMLAGDAFSVQCERVFENLQAVAEAAGGSLQDIVKLTVFLSDLSNFPTVNAIMARFFSEPYPARAAVGVAALPKESQVEVDAIMDLAE
jgi:reactive intermediate/imine deaminase